MYFPRRCIWFRASKGDQDKSCCVRNLPHPSLPVDWIFAKLLDQEGPTWCSLLLISLVMTLFPLWGAFLSLSHSCQIISSVLHWEQTVYLRWLNCYGVPVPQAWANCRYWVQTLRMELYWSCLHANLSSVGDKTHTMCIFGVVIARRILLPQS